MNHFIKATVVRMVRTFLSTILGVWTAGTLITDIDWKATLVAALSATVYIGITCIVAGLPEVEYKQHLYQYRDEPDDAEAEEDEEDEEDVYEDE